MGDADFSCPCFLIYYALSRPAYDCFTGQDCRGIGSYGNDVLLPYICISPEKLYILHQDLDSRYLP